VENTPGKPRGTVTRRHDLVSVISPPILTARSCSVARAKMTAVHLGCFLVELGTTGSASHTPCWHRVPNQKNCADRRPGCAAVGSKNPRPAEISCKMVSAANFNQPPSVWVVRPGRLATHYSQASRSQMYKHIFNVILLASRWTRSTLPRKCRHAFCSLAASLLLSTCDQCPSRQWDE
jgi:hypothetical protein